MKSSNFYELNQGISPCSRLVLKTGVLSVALSALLLFPGLAHAGGKGFYNTEEGQGSVSDFSSSPPTLSDQDELEYFPRQVKREDFAIEPTKLDLKKADPKKTEASKTPSDPKEIVEAFGDPSKDAAIPVVDTAPVPVKGMMAALAAKQDDLAFSYARQYARHLRNLQNNNTRFTSLVGLAMKREGMAQPGDWTDSAALPGDKEIFEKDLAQARAMRGDVSAVSELDEKARALFEKASKFGDEEEGDSDAEVTADVRANLSDEQYERAKARNAVGARITPGQGPITVYFFFRIQDGEATSMVPALSQLQKTWQGKNVNIAGLTFDETTAPVLRDAAVKIKSTFPLLSGSRLVKQMNLSTSPTVVVMSGNSNKAIFEEGVRSFYYLDEIIRMMQGGSAQ